jgi:hypothetical protein
MRATSSAPIFGRITWEIFPLRDRSFHSKPHITVNPSLIKVLSQIMDFSSSRYVRCPNISITCNIHPDFVLVDTCFVGEMNLCDIYTYLEDKINLQRAVHEGVSRSFRNECLER